MKNMPKASIILQAIQGFFTTWAFMKAGRMEPGNILNGVFFIFFMIFYQYSHNRLATLDKAYRRRISLASFVIGPLFALLYVAVDSPNYIDTLTNPLFRLGILGAVFTGFSILFYHLLGLLYFCTADTAGLRKMLFASPSWASHTKGLHRLLSFYNRHMGLCAFLLCLLCWLPYFLYQYPGIMTPDSLNQFEQVLGVIPYSNHHPWVHTLLIKLFYTIGYRITGSMLVALSFYTFFQMCALSLSVCYFINTLKLCLVKPGICFGITLFYALVPYHGVYSVTLWKDILFAAFVLSFGCACVRLKKNPLPEKGETAKAAPKPAHYADLGVFALCALAICLFRSNGWYAFLLCLPFLLLSFRKRARVMFPVLAGVFLTAVLIKYPVMKAFHVTPPDFVESLSIPIQQVAAVICNGRELKEDELALIEKVADLTYVKELYNIHYADNIKELVRAGNPDYLSSHKGAFLKLWAKLGMRYPGDYLTAYVYQTYGYWYPDSFYPVADAEGVSATSLGVSHTPLIGGPLVVKSKEIAIKLGGMVPLYGILWSMGAVCWALIFCLGSAFVRREKEKLILYLPGTALLLTVLVATPVATEFRYVYFMVFSLPFYLMAAVFPMETKGQV